MKARQIVSIVLGMILILLALYMLLARVPATETQTGQMSVLFAVFLGVFIVASGLKQPKTKELPAGQDQLPPPPPTTDEDLPPPPPGYEPAPQPQPALQRPKPSTSVKTQQIVAVIVVAIVVVAAFLVLFGGSILGIGGPFSGTWRGTAEYYYIDIYGQRDSKIDGTVVMKLTQTGSTVKGTLDIQPTNQVNLGDPGYVPAVEEHKSISGSVNGTRLTFYVEGVMFTGYASNYMEFWEFTKTDSTLVGKVTNLDTYAYLGIESDSGGFQLSK